MNTGAFGEGFPYTNFHDMNLDWVIKIAKDFLDQYTHLQETITNGEEALNTLAEQLQEALNGSYTEYSEELNGSYTEYSEELREQLADALEDLNIWYTEHQNYLDATLAQNILAFQTEANAYGQSVIDSIPSEYGEVTNLIKAVMPNTEEHIFNSAWNYFYGYGYFNSSLEWTEYSDIVTLRVPLSASEFVILSHTADFMLNISNPYPFTFELEDGTITRTTPSGTQYTNRPTHTDENYEACALGFTDCKYVYFAVNPPKIGGIKVIGSKFPFYNRESYLSDGAIYEISKYNTAYAQTYMNESSISLLTTSHVYWKVVHTGDIIGNLTLQTGLSYYGAYKSADGTIRQRINSSTFTVPADGVVCLFTDGSLRAKLIPALRFKLYASDIIGEQSENLYNGLNGVAFGTSLTYRSQTTGGYLNYLPQMSGITFDNQGIGSGKIKTDILTAIRNYTGYANKRVAIIEGFVNDFGYNANSLGVYTDNTDSTVCGCVRLAINYILSQNANITVFLVLDHYGRDYGGTDSSSTSTNSAGKTQYEWWEEISKVAESLGVPVIPLYKISGISENTPQYLADNIHPTSLGAQQTANAIWEVMKNIYPNAVL